MRTSLLCLVVIFMATQLDAAPAPDQRHKAKEKLEALKKRLPDLVGEWAKKRENTGWLPRQGTYNPELRVLRRLGPDRAKAVILFTAFDVAGGQAPSYDVLLTIFLTYHEGCWTTERFEASNRTNGEAVRPTFAFLMLEIDEAAEKP
jgi:hypothetical protein